MGITLIVPQDIGYNGNMSEHVVPAIRFPLLKSEHIGKWIAMGTSGEFIAASDTLHELRQKTSFHKQKTIFRMLPHVFAGSNL